MRLAVSNIAWTAHDSPEVLAMFRDYAVTGIEVAPTKVWPGWQGATVAAAEKYRMKMADAGFSIPALQAVLFGKPDARLFDSAGRLVFVDHLRTVAALARALGSTAVVLGAPSQRDRGELSPGEAFDQAASVFRELGRVFADQGTCLCIEPNPRRYGCNFVINAEEGLALVRAVASPGFALHLDAAGMYLEGDSLAAVWDRVNPALRHFHMSEPDLGDFSHPVVNHAENLRVLRAGGYSGWVSIELREPKDGTAGLARAIRCVQSSVAPA